MKKAFTLVEVLITLGIIGVVVAITIPIITANVQKIVLKNQLKNFVTMFYQGIGQVKANLNPDIRCYYWDSSPYTKKCALRNQYGNCIKWTLSDGSPLPSDITGGIDECREFDSELFGNVIKVAKFCEKNALANGCLSDTHKGLDKVLSQQNPDVPQDPNGLFSDLSIKNKYPALVLTDGTIIIRYYYMGFLPIYAVDVNGFKGPNKWGYDIFVFQIIGNKAKGIIGIKGAYDTIEKGGTASSTMFSQLFSK